jgi:hypothetical protein
MTIAKVFLAGLLAGVLVTPVAALAFDGDSFATKFEGLPQPVKDTAKAHMDHAFPVSITSAKGEKGWNYQINTRIDGKYHDLVIDESGKLVAVKDETELGSLPAAAQAVIGKQAAAGKIVTLEKVTEGAQVSYGAVLKDESQGTFVQMRVAPDGTVQSRK